MMEILGASVAIVVPGEQLGDNDIVTIQRDDIPEISYPGMSEVPGGGLESGETPQKCVIRETGEEVGIDLPEEAIVWMAFYASRCQPGKYNAFLVARLDHRPQLQLGNEGRSCRLMPYGEFALSGQVIIDHVDRFQDYLRGIDGSYIPARSLARGRAGYGQQIRKHAT